MKKLTLLLSCVLALLTIPAWGATTIIDDPIHAFPDFYLHDDEYYYTFGRYDYNFNYQLRDVSGERDGHTIAGAQWFATIYENTLWNNIYRYEIQTDETWYRWRYRRTLGGEMPEITMVTSADLLYDFESVFIDEPEPYPASTIYQNWWIYSHDVFFDPIETVCVVIPEGRGELRVDFGNHYARHFPYWWDEYNRPINPPGDSVTVYTISGDEVLDTSKVVVCVVSGDEIYDPARANVLYTISTTVSGDNVYDASSGRLVYTVVPPSPVPLGSIRHVYAPSGAPVYTISDDVILGSSVARDVAEDILMSVEGYDIAVQPNTPRRIRPAEYLNASIRLTAEDAEGYGSTVGTLVFRQSASFDTGYTGWRESIQIPIVVANVHDGPASDPGNELLFDMRVLDTTASDDIVERIKFRWGADENMTQDLGTFFMMRPTNTSLPTYALETRVTNRTGTRYRLQRYDMIGSRPTSYDTTIEPPYRLDYRDIRPDHWKYDVTPDLYGSLPTSFQLDKQSQIAPGLITVYRHDVGRGYSTIDMTYGTSESFRLYPFSSSAYKELTLSYRRVAGMTLGGGSSSSAGRWRARGFHMGFVDLRQDEDNTERELETMMGKPPVMIPTGAAGVSASDAYIRSSALNAFTISTLVPAGLVSMDLEIVSRDASGDVIESREVPAEIAIQPVTIRLRVPRQEALLRSRWAELENAASSRELLRIFSRFGSIWVRSMSTRALDRDLLAALGDRGVDPSDCIRAFTYDDELYLDFIVFLADAKSPKEGYTGYIDVFEDDGIPYILIGDGEADGKWELSFYIDSAGADPEPERPTSGDVAPAGKEEGGGCGAWPWGLLALPCTSALVRVCVQGRARRKV